jgi:hypothetical protein
MKNIFNKRVTIKKITIKPDNKRKRNLIVRILIGIATAISISISFDIKLNSIFQNSQNAKLEIIESSPLVVGDSYVTEITVINHGDGAATGVVIGNSVYYEKNFSLFPYKSSSIEIESQSEVQKMSHIKIDALSPGESASFVVFCEKNKFDILDKEARSVGYNFLKPAKVTYADYNEGTQQDIDFSSVLL